MRCFAEVVREIRANRSHSHRRAIPERALSAEHLRGDAAPVSAGRELKELPVRHRAIAAFGVTLESSSESRRQRILIDRPVRFQYLQQHNAHLVSSEYARRSHGIQVFWRPAASPTDDIERDARRRQRSCWRYSL